MRRSGRVAPFVIKFEVDCTVLSCILSLSVRHLFKTRIVTVKKAETVGDLIGPERKIRDVACELASIQCDEAPQLRR